MGGIRTFDFTEGILNEVAPSVGGASPPTLEPTWADDWDSRWDSLPHPEKKSFGRGSRVGIGVAIILLVVGLGALIISHRGANPGTPRWDGYPSVVAGVACPSASHCVITGAEGVADNGGPSLAMVTSDGTKTWRAGQLPRNLGGSALTSVSCPTVTACLAVGGGRTLLASDDGGLTWKERPRFTISGNRSSPSVSALQCVTTSRCFALTGDNTVASTADGGRTWHLIPGVFARPFPMTATAFDCASPAACVMVGTSTGPHLSTVPTALTTLDGGVTWNVVDLPQGLPGNPADVSCPTAVRCFVVTDNLSPVVVSIVLNGNHWSASNAGFVDASLKPLVDEAGSSENTIQCATPTQCMVVGGGNNLFSQAPPAVNVTEDGGIVWRSLNLGALIPVDPACPTPTFCMALDTNAQVFNSEIDPMGLSDAVIISRDGEQTWSVIRPRTHS
jgi:photosystem II stability/assembly factor-like uncharacterized protein